MKRLSLSLFIVALLGCKSSHHEAIKLNDSAVAVVMSSATNESQEEKYEKAIALLNHATRIDSDYVTGYLNKFSFQNGLKNYKEAIITGDKLIKLMPTDGEMQVRVGEIFEKLGNIKTALKYYTIGLENLNDQLKGVVAGSDQYKTFKCNKDACILLIEKCKTN